MDTWLKKHIIRPVRDNVLYALASFLFFLGRILPRRLLLAQNGALSKLVYRLSKKQSAIMVDNLTKVYGPEKEAGEYWRLGGRVYRNLALTFTDYAIWGKKKSWDFFSRFFTVEGEEHLKAAVQRGRGVLCLVPHSVAWEFSAIMLPILGYTTSWVTSRIKNPALGKLLTKHRESRGVEIIIRHHCYDHVVEVLRSGGCVIMMTDQDSKNIRGEFLDFMGLKAYSPTGCSRLAADTGAAVVPICTIRGDDGRYKFTVYPELQPVYASDGSYDIHANTQQQNDVLSQMIFDHPDQWVWFHQRWDTTPESLEQFLEEKRRAQ